MGRERVPGRVLNIECDDEDPRARSAHCCSYMDMLINTGEYTIYYYTKLREYSIGALDLEGIHPLITMLITYCPWCGSQLPSSLRHEWFDRLERMDRT